MPIHLRPWQQHSHVLAVAGGVYVTYGAVALILADPTARTSSRGIADLIPAGIWGALWIAVGLLALVSTRWPPGSKTWGYTALSSLAAWWAACYLTGAFIGTGTFQPGGAIVWALVAYLWYAVAGLVNPDDVVPIPTVELG